MTTKKAILIGLAFLSFAVALGTLIWMKKIEQQLLEPTPGMFKLQTGEHIHSSTSSEHTGLQSEFNDLFSGEHLGGMYEDMTEYGFTGS